MAHVFNAWTRMPTVAEQIAMPDAFTADFSVMRALLQKGRTYEQAVSMFEPYHETKEPDNSTRDALRKVAERAIQKRQRAYVWDLLSSGLCSPIGNCRPGLMCQMPCTLHQGRCKSEHRWPTWIAEASL